MTDMDDIKIQIDKIVKGNLNERREAVAVLSGMGEKAVDPLIALLGSGVDNDIMWYVSSALAKIGEPAVDSLIFTLKNYPDDNVRRYVAAALAGIGEPSVPSLIEIFDEDDAVVRGFASKALIRIGSPAVDSLNRFISESEPESISHRCAVITLHKLGSEDPESVEKVL